MSVAKHKACFTTKLQGQNLATFSHSAVTPIAYLQHTVNTNKTCVNNALIMCLKINAVNNAIKKINRSTALLECCILLGVWRRWGVCGSDDVVWYFIIAVSSGWRTSSRAWWHLDSRSAAQTWHALHLGGCRQVWFSSPPTVNQCGIIL